jgi:hypothetical protein
MIKSKIMALRHFHKKVPATTQRHKREKHGVKPSAKLCRLKRARAITPRIPAKYGKRSVALPRLIVLSHNGYPVRTRSKA